MYFGDLLWTSLIKVKLPELEEVEFEMIYSDVLVRAEILRGANEQGEVAHPDEDTYIE